MDPKALPDDTGKIVLVVEDEPVLRAILMRILRFEGYTALEAGDGRGAVALFDEHPAAIPLVLMDLQLPGPDGIHVAADLRSRRPDLSVIYMSGSIESAQLSLAAREEFLSKPFLAGQLTDLVRRTLDAAA